MTIHDIVAWTPWTTVGIVVGLLIYFLMNPAKVEKWSAIIAGLVEKSSARAARRGAASEIQAAASKYVKDTGSEDILPYGLKINWVKENIVESYVDKKHERIMVIMQYKKSRSRNFVTAIREYTSKTFISSVRHDVPRQIVTAAELVMVEKIIRAERKDAMDIFRDEVLPSQIGDDRELDALHKSLKRIEGLGFFENIFLNEILIARDALKTFDDSDKASELDALIDFLTLFHKRAPGEDITLEHNRRLFRLSVILVAKTSSMLAGGTDLYAKRASKSLSQGLRSVYVTGTKDDRKYVVKVVDRISDDGALSLEWVRDYKKTKDMETRNYTIAFFRR